MPVEIGIWRLGDKPEKIEMSSLDLEKTLQAALTKDLSILSKGHMLIGGKIMTAQGKELDLLAMDSEGNLAIIELKREKTPRDVVAQILDYASWVQNLSREEITNIFMEKNNGRKLEEAFADFFGISLPEEINQSHDLTIVATDLDPATERIINYLANTYDVPINAVFFRVFKDEGRNYLSRTWLIDPEEMERKASESKAKKGSEPWNGHDFYVSFGEGQGEHRTWEDAMKYGFISGGQGKWYSQTLNLLFPGARVFVNIPSVGYVGVGIVKERAVMVKDFNVIVDGKEKSILQAPLKASNMGDHQDDPEMSEYAVRVDWMKKVPVKDAYWTKGLFAIQHTACRLKSSFTIEKLSEHFKLED